MRRFRGPVAFGLKGSNPFPGVQTKELKNLILMYYLKKRNVYYTSACEPDEKPVYAPEEGGEDEY